ncbi:MAG: hypothetical protein AAF206_01830 [Bacteroidota bacterium]
MNKVIVGVLVSVISAVIIAYLGLNRTSPPVPTPSSTSTVKMGEWCCDAWGNKRCQLVSGAPVGNSCYCYGIVGAGTICQ